MMAEETVRRSEAQYRQLTDAMPQLAWIAGADGQVEYFNRGWYDYTGTSSEQMLGPNRPTVVHPEDRPMAMAMWQQAVASVEPYEVEYRLRSRDGSYQWFLARGVPLTDDQGKAVKWFGTCTNVDPQTRASRNERFLSDSSAALASSLDYETTLATVARLAVPHMADWCIVHIVEPNDHVRPLAAAHVDPDKVRWARELQARYPATPRGVARVLQTGSTEIFPNITEEMVAASAQDSEHFQMLLQVGFKSQMTVPMIARGQVMGAISFVSAESGRIYQPADVPIAEDLARSAALAVDNARSFLAAQHEIDRRQDTERQLLLRQEEVEALNAKLRHAVEVTHHHVRNNLQIILALTQLPVEDDVDTVPASALGRIGRHTSALAAMHDLLMRQAKSTADVGRLSAHSALEKLIPMLEAISPGREIRYRADDIRLPVQEIGSLCLLVNELITNSILHGDGKIALSITSLEDMARLEVSDEGPGFPEGFDWRSVTSTGLCLIDIAGRHDLRGTVNYSNGERGGARVVVEFPLE
jgi:PAS domain S-box-containing protein